MQYQFIGQDQAGRLIYEPVTSNTQAKISEQTSYQFYDPNTDESIISKQENTIQETQRTLIVTSYNKSKSSSIFSGFFVIDDGIISISLKSMTLLFSFLISFSLLYMLYQSCSDGTFECDLKDFPMVSNVIALEMNTRVFLLLTCAFMFGVNQVNIRAYYKKMYGIVSNGHNDTMYYIGLVSLVSLPLIGIFDMHQWKLEHGILAVAFFLSFGVYAVMIANAMYSNIDKFPTDEQSSIKALKKNSTGLMISLGLLGLSALLHGPTPLFEWITVLYYLNFFAILAGTNNFYDSVHQEGTLIPQQKQ